MKLEHTIKCTIDKNGFHMNGEVQFASKNADADSFLKELYHFLGTDYARFYKMDNLSKLGFLAVEAMVKYHPEIKSYGDDEIALICAGKHSSLETDATYWEGVTAAPPVASPSLFVYTLPNILLGEIAIRHKWFGENLSLVLESHDAELIDKQAELLIATGKAKACIAGWIDFFENHYEAEFSFIKATS